MDFSHHVLDYNMADPKRKPLRESQLDKKQVERAVPALMKYVSQKRRKQLQLLDEYETILLILALKKIPGPDKKPRKIPLPHSLHADAVEVCLFSKEEGSKTKEILKSKGIHCIKKVISLTKLRKNYQSFESKRQLASLYDIFICDDTIYHLLPKLLGKTFFFKKKFPIPVNMKKKNLKGEIAGVLNCTQLSLGHGPCSGIKVAHTGQPVEEAVENIMSSVSCIARIVPRGWDNIKSLNLKTTDSISLPIYNSLPDKSVSVELPQPPKKKKRKMEMGEMQEQQDQS